MTVGCGRVATGMFIAWAVSAAATASGGDSPRARGTEWPQRNGGPGRASVSPDESVKPPLRMVWSYRCDSDTSGDAGSGLTVGGGKVFGNMEMGGTILALDAETGRFLWEYRHQFTHPRQTSSYADGRLYVWLRGRGRSSLVALDSETGEEVWSKALRSSGEDVRHYGRAGPLLFGGKVIMPDMGPQEGDEPLMLALDGRTGEELWRRPLGRDNGDLIAAPCAAVLPGNCEDSGTQGPSAHLVFASTRTRFVRGKDDQMRGRVVALNAETGEIVWSNRSVYSSWSGQLVSDGKVVVCMIGRQIGMQAADNQKMYVLDARTGEELWSTRADNSLRNVAITAEQIIGKSYGGSLTAYDRGTGKCNWSLTIRTGSGCSSPSVSGDYAYVGTGSFNDSEGLWAWRFVEPPHTVRGEEGVSWTLHAIDLRTGQSIWRFLTGCNVCGDPAIAYGRVYFNSRDGRIYCLEPVQESQPALPESPDASPDAAPEQVRRLLAEEPPAWRPGKDWPMLGGNPQRFAQAAALSMPLEPAWQLDTGGRVVGAAAICGGRAFAGSLSGKIVAADLETGAQVWQFDTGAQVRCSPAVADGLVYCGSDNGRFYALDAASGKERWSYQCGGPVQASPAVFGGVVVFGANDHNVYMLDRRTGRKLWSFRTDYPLVQAPPVVHGDRVFAAQWVDWAYALDAVTGKPQWRTCVPISIESLHLHQDRLWLRTPRQIAEFDPAVGKRLRIANASYGYNGVAFLGNLLVHSGTRGAAAVDLNDAGVLNNYADRVPALSEVRVLSARNLGGWPGLASMSSPLVIGGAVCFATAGGEVIVTQPDPTTIGGRVLSHKVLWSTSLGGTCHSSPVAADGVLVVGCDDGKLHAFRESGPVRRPAGPGAATD